MDWLRRMAAKYRAFILYALFGAVTTAVNVVVYWLCIRPLNMGNDPAVIIAWVAAVLTAFLTNKPFVFDSHDWSAKVLLPEALNFFGCRLGTGVLEFILMHIFVEVLCYPEILMKLLVNVVVIILNYVASKLLVFRKKSS